MGPLKRPAPEIAALEETDLFLKAKKFASDGRISHSEAKELWADGHLSQHELEVLRHITHSFHFTYKAMAWIQPLLHSPKKTSYYRQVHGQRYDRELLDMAERFVKDGQISYAEAHSLWHSAQDGKGVTEVERKTLQYTLDHMKYTTKAAAFLRLKLDEGKVQKVGRKSSLLPKVGDKAKVRQLKKADSKDAKESNVKPKASVGSPAKGPIGHGKDAISINLSGPGKDEKPGGKSPKKSPKDKQKVLIKWKWVKRPNSGFPAFPVVMPRKAHRFSLVVCHPMGCYSTFFLGPEGLVKDLLVQSKMIRDYCKILCPGARHIEWGKQWFRYRSNRGGTRQCHAEIISTRDLQRAVDFVSGVVSSEVSTLGAADRVLLGGYSQGGCISLAVGLALPFDIGLIISQRGMLMKQTMDRHSVNGETVSQTDKAGGTHSDKTSKKPVYHSKPRIFMSAGVLDDVYLLENQADGRSWLEKYGCKVEFQAVKTLDRYENSHEEHALVRKAVLATFKRARKIESPKKVKRPLSKTLSEPSDSSR